MDLTNRRNPFNNPFFPPPLWPPPPPSRPFILRQGSSAVNVPIIAVAVIGILAVAFLLVTYYVFVIKCCLNWDQMNIFRRRRRSSDQNPLMVYTPHDQKQGLDEAAIRAIPLFKFKKRDVVAGEEDENKNSQECSVCLNEFQEDEKLRIIPNCCHVFHIDCIDTWLQDNANCPLCRTSISCEASYHLDLISSPENSSPESRITEPESVLGDDNDCVVIELGISNGDQGENARNRGFLAGQESVASGEVLTGNTLQPTSPSPRKVNHRAMQKRGRKFHKIMSMGDECIDTRSKVADQFGEVQSIRRSISMDSSADHKLNLAVEEAISRESKPIPLAGDSGGNNRVMKRCFFSLKSSKVSKTSSILPLYLEP